jgi:hypothetical protein
MGNLPQTNIIQESIGFPILDSLPFRSIVSRVPNLVPKSSAQFAFQ